MNFFLSKLKLASPLVAILAAALSAGAQPAGQAIIFSSPQNTNASASTPSLSPPTPDQPNFADELQAPKLLLQSQLPAQPLPLSQPQGISPAGQERMKQWREDQKNWALMTPEEIFGMTSPETNATGLEKNQTQFERYLERQKRSQTSDTNSLRNDRPNSPWDFSRDQPNANPFGSDNPEPGNAGPGLSRFLAGDQENRAATNQNENSGWNLFGTSPASPATKPDLVQQAAMERFRQLLVPSSVAVVEATPSPNSSFFPSPKLTPDPNFTQPNFVPNPAGASFTPLASGIGRPTGLTPLPGIMMPNLPSVAVPAWMPQPAPWLSQGPQLFTIPQRKF
jgi:hypothetical protein